MFIQGIILAAPSLDNDINNNRIKILCKKLMHAYRHSHTQAQTDTLTLS